MEDQLLLPKEVSTRMTQLEILENDAIDTFTRMFIALPHVVENLSVINIRSTHNNDFQYRTEDMFVCLLPQLTKLNTLVFTVGEVFEKESDTLHNLYKQLPPNISTLRFRGPASIVKSGEWDGWINSFESLDFLPKLRRLSFVLDLYYDEAKTDFGKRNLAPAPDDILQHVQEACKTLHRVVEKRGVVVEPFNDKWSDRSAHFKQVDMRWVQ